MMKEKLQDEFLVLFWAFVCRQSRLTVLSKDTKGERLKIHIGWSVNLPSHTWFDCLMQRKEGKNEISSNWRSLTAATLVSGFSPSNNARDLVTATWKLRFSALNRRHNDDANSPLSSRPNPPADWLWKWLFPGIGRVVGVKFNWKIEKRINYRFACESVAGAWGRISSAPSPNKANLHKALPKAVRWNRN